MHVTALDTISVALRTSKCVYGVGRLSVSLFDRQSVSEKGRFLTRRMLSNVVLARVIVITGTV